MNNLSFIFSAFIVIVFFGKFTYDEIMQIKYYEGNLDTGIIFIGLYSFVIVSTIVFAIKNMLW